MRATAIAAGVAAALAAFAAWRMHSRSPAPDAPPPSVLLVTVDTLRADALGTPDGETPWMDRLAKGGVRFDAAHAHNVLTLPSHANILSGRYPFDHGVRDNAGFRFPSGIDTVATLLKARGYRTGAFVSAFPLDSRFGLSRGFDVYEDDFVGAGAAPAFLLHERRGTETVARARRWIEAGGSAPTLTWVHVFEPHFPYEPPEPWATRFRGREYRGEVAATDALLRPLLEPILAQGANGRTLVVLTADHGESLGEHGEATHGIFAYEATLKVPLLLYLPGRVRPGISRTTARHVDVLPTILHAVAASPVPGLPGRSLLEDGSGTPAPEAASYFEALSGTLNRGWAPLHGLLRGNEKYIDLPVDELYDLAADPAESRNLAASRPGDVEAARVALARFRTADRGGAREPETAETVERLRSLGYTAAGQAPSAPEREYTAADDPKSLIALDADLEAIVRDYQQGDSSRALARSRDLVRRHPGMPVALLQLAHLERESGNLDAGIAALRHALAVDPANATALALLGAYLTQAGRGSEAARLLEPHSLGPAPDFDVLTTRALALARSGALREALATLAKARAADPTNVMILVHEGTVHLMGGDRGRARAAFTEAVARHPGVARAHSSLGMMAAEDGSLDEARAHWTQAIRLDAREAGKLLALASLLGERKREVEARAYLELFIATAPAGMYAREIAGVRQFLAQTGAHSGR